MRYVESLKKNIVLKSFVMKKESEEYDEYVILCFDIHIIRDNSESNTVNTKRQKLKDELFSSTLTNINRERMKIKKITTELSKYIPPQIHDALFAGNMTQRLKHKEGS